MADDKTRTGYDQADEYIRKNATIGIEPPPAYEQAPPHATDDYTTKNTTFGAELPPGYEQALPHATDDYTTKNTTFGAEPPPAYEQALAQTDGGYRQLPYAETSTNVVVNQPQQFVGVAIQKRPMDYTVLSILACLCCCWPIGLCAMRYATDANTLWKEGDFEGARRKAKIARNLIIACAVFGVITSGIIYAYRIFVDKSRDNHSEIDQSGGW